MSTFTVGSPPDRDGAPILLDGVFEEAFDGPGDPRKNPALLHLIRQMVPYAMTVIRAALDETNPHRGKAPTTGQMRELVQAQRVHLPDDDPDEDDSLRSRTDWVLVSRDPRALQAEQIRSGGGAPAEDRPDWRTWTDDYSNLVQILK